MLINIHKKISVKKISQEVNSNIWNFFDSSINNKFDRRSKLLKR